MTLPNRARFETEQHTRVCISLRGGADNDNDSTAAEAEATVEESPVLALKELFSAVKRDSLKNTGSQTALDTEKSDRAAWSKESEEYITRLQHQRDDARKELERMRKLLLEMVVRLGIPPPTDPSGGSRHGQHPEFLETGGYEGWAGSDGPIAGQKRKAQRDPDEQSQNRRPRPGGAASQRQETIEIVMQELERRA